MFDKVITPEFKKLFKDSIDTLLAANALTVPCTLEFESIKRDLCYNCEFDPITQRSANKPKPNPHVYFAHETICPVCNGFGFIDSSKDEIVRSVLRTKANKNSSVVIFDTEDGIQSTCFGLVTFSQRCSAPSLDLFLPFLLVMYSSTCTL